MGDMLKVLTELSFDNLFVIVGLGFIAVAVFGNISGKISPDAKGRIASAIVGACLLVSGLWWHAQAHGFRVTSVALASPPRSQAVSCPTKIPLQGIIEAAGSGGVLYYFEFSDGNATSPDRIDFSQSDSKIVPGQWDLKGSLTNARVKLNTIAPKKMSSPFSNPFSVTCVQNGQPKTVENQQPGTGGAPGSPPPPTPNIGPPAPSVMTSAATEATDSVELVAVSPKPGTHLGRGQPLPFGIAVTYNLVSADVAILSLSTAQFPASMGACSGSGGELVDAIQVPIQRGRHEVKVSLTWSGDTGRASKGRVFGQGYIGFAPMFWANNNGSRGERLKFFGINPDFCYPFGP